MFADNFNKSKIITALVVIVFGVLGRFFLIKFVGLPNFEIITALTLVSAVFLGRIWALAVPLSIIAITDIFIGNNSVMFFTWSAFAIIGVIGWFSRSVILKDSSILSLRGAERRSNPEFIAPLARSFDNLRMAIIKLTGMGIVASIFFFLYTNFGWWLLSNMYPHNLDGLIQCYIMGLPFFKNNLIGNLIFMPITSGAAIFLKSVLKNKIWNQGKIAIFHKN